MASVGALRLRLRRRLPLALGLKKMRTVISGSKETFAIECVDQDPIKGLGNIYFWLAGVRLGNDLFPFELPSYFHGALAELGRIPQSDELVEIDADAYADLVDWLYDETTCPISNTLNEAALRKAVDQSIWRDYYASDRILLGIANGHGQQVIHGCQEGAPSVTARTETDAFQTHMREIATQLGMK